jgi:hypothetical protein
MRYPIRLLPWKFHLSSREASRSPFQCERREKIWMDGSMVDQLHDGDVQ